MDFENIYQSRKHILKMLKMRGYDTQKYENQNKEEIMILFQNRDKKATTIQDTLDILIEGDDNKVFVKYILNEKTRSNLIEKNIENYYYNDLFLEKNDVCIFITKDKVTYKGRLENYMNNLYLTDKIFCQVIWLNSMLYDMTLNKLIPKYKILTEEEKQGIVQKFNINSDSDFPNILINDPLGVFYGLKIGQVVEVHYPSKTNGFTKYYRLCVSGI